jgi:hypothetical protein
VVRSSTNQSSPKIWDVRIFPIDQKVDIGAYDENVIIVIAWTTVLAIILESNANHLFLKAGFFANQRNMNDARKKDWRRGLFKNITGARP